MIVAVTGAVCAVGGGSAVAQPVHASGHTHGRCADVDSRAARPPAAGPVVRHDFDGDGRRDRVVVRQQRPPRCPHLVLFGTRIGRVSAAIKQFGLELPWPDAETVGTPRLVTAVPIAQKGPPQIVVTTASAGSGISVAIFTFRQGRLTRVHVAGVHELRDAFWVGAGASTGGATVDCYRHARSGAVIVTEFDAPRDGRFRVQQRIYGLRGTAFRLTRTLRERRVRTIPGAGRRLFHSCSRDP
jgi:hypothetical protein